MRSGNVLRDSGIHKGDQVLVILPRGTDVYAVSIGIWAIGGVVVPGTIMLRRADIEYRIGPFEVENAVDSHESVLECAMIPSPGPIRGEIVKVFVVLKGCPTKITVITAKNTPTTNKQPKTQSTVNYLRILTNKPK